MPQLWQKWQTMSAHTGALDSSSRQGISCVGFCARAALGVKRRHHQHRSMTHAGVGAQECS